MEFVFLGANIDAVETAGRFGISADHAVDYVPDGAGTELNFHMMSDAVATFRETRAMPQAPLEAIRKDMKKRGQRKGVAYGVTQWLKGRAREYLGKSLRDVLRHWRGEISRRGGSDRNK